MVLSKERESTGRKGGEGALIPSKEKEKSGDLTSRRRLLLRGEFKKRNKNHERKEHFFLQRKRFFLTPLGKKLFSTIVGRKGEAVSKLIGREGKVTSTFTKRILHFL